MFYRFAALAMLLACALTLPVSGASARTDAMVEYTCPIDGKTFQWLTPMSGTSFGARLDGRPIGPTASPYPYPVCPGNGFVLYRDSKKLDAAYIAKAKALVETEEYRRIRDSESPYFLAVFIAERLDEGAGRIATLARDAAWDSEGHAERHNRYARLAADRLRALQASDADHNEGWVYRQVVAAELFRQAGAFDEARKMLSDTPSDLLDQLLTKHAPLKEKVDELRKRIEAQDTHPI